LLLLLLLLLLRITRHHIHQTLTPIPQPQRASALSKRCLWVHALPQQPLLLLLKAWQSQPPLAHKHTTTTTTNPQRVTPHLVRGVFGCTQLLLLLLLLLPLQP
jgi:hypothetical protein